MKRVKCNLACIYIRPEYSEYSVKSVCSEMRKKGLCKKAIK